MHISFFPEKLAEIFGVPISNALLMSWLAILVLAAFSYFASKKLKVVPGRLQSIAELTVELMMNFMTTVTGDKERTRRFFPLTATLFLFILVSNWMGILPGVGSMGILEHEEFIPFFRSTNSDINMTLALAVISVFATQMFGIAGVGFLNHLSRYLSLKSPISFFIGILESIAEIAKILSFSFRLFGNIFAGEVLLMVIFFLVPLIIPLPFMFLEIFVGFVQALVFSMLTLVFLTIATAKEH